MILTQLLVLSLRVPGGEVTLEQPLDGIQVCFLLAVPLTVPLVLVLFCCKEGSPPPPPPPSVDFFFFFAFGRLW